MNSTDTHTHANRQQHPGAGACGTAHGLDRGQGWPRCRGNTPQFCGSHGCHGEDGFTAGLWPRRARICAVCFRLSPGVFIAHITIFPPLKTENSAVKARRHRRGRLPPPPTYAEITSPVTCSALLFPPVRASEVDRDERRGCPQPRRRPGPAVPASECPAHIRHLQNCQNVSGFNRSHYTHNSTRMKV